MKRALMVGAALAVATWLGQASAATFTVSAATGTFQPPALTIAVGDTVNWVAIASGGHTVTSNDNAWPPWTSDFDFTFTAAGQYPYFCENHFGMTGSITVQTAAATDTPTSTPLPTSTPASGQLRMLVALAADNGGIGSGDVAVYQGTFFPKTLEVAAGARVVWHDQATQHTVTSDQGLFDSGILGPGQEFAFTFAQPGTYPYHCMLHGAPGGFGHSGTVVVRQRGATTSDRVLTPHRGA
jgi:plastocyanin